VLSGSFIYVHIVDRALFDSIDRRRIDRQADGRGLVMKRLEQDGITVVFHHWTSQPSEMVSE
jgi:hypothetical protein